MSVSREQKASPAETVRVLGADLLQLNLSAYRLGHHGLAHHLLCAALHCAQGSADVLLAEGVMQRAEDQRSELERSPYPDGDLAEALRGRSTVNMFGSVAAMAASVSQRLRAHHPFPRTT